LDGTVYQHTTSEGWTLSNNDAALALAAKYNKELGPGAIMIASEMVVPRRFTSGSLGLDISIGGGWAANQWAEIYGPENHGKTAITLKTIAANQQENPDHYTLWVASEHYDLDQASALGVDTDRVQVLSTRDMATAYDVTLDYLNERACDAVVIDSYPALIPPQEDEKEMDEYTQAEGAKMTNKFFRKVGKAGLRNPSDPGDRPWLGLFINQPREKIGGWAPNGAVPETTPGGRGKNFAFYTRLNVKRVEFILDGPKSAKNHVGQVIRTQAFKNKGGPPMGVSSIDFYFKDSLLFSRGDYDIAKDVTTMAVLLGVVHRGGSWFRYEDRQWQGLPSVLASVREEPDLLAAIEKRTREIALHPENQMAFTEDEVESASTARTTIRRKRRDDQ
jgi:recombination protein RecA